MGFSIRYVCDWCGKDLSRTGNCVGWRIHLSCEQILSNEGMVTLLHIPNPLPDMLCFCGTQCLGNYARVKEWGSG